jgi:hypothetical protein
VAPDRRLASAEDVARLVNGQNATGVAFAARLSTRQLVDLLAVVGPWVSDVIGTLPLHGPAIFPVSWAGESASENWMDTGREYTEHWHHQMQIRDAVGAPLLLSPRWVDPLFDIAVRVLPAAYANTAADAGTALVFEVAVDGDKPRAWTLIRAADRWTLERGARPDAACIVRTTADAAWRLFFNALPEALARAAIGLSGDVALAEPLMRARSVVL